MATHPGMVLAYDTNGDVVATLDYLVQYEDDGTPIGIVDFAGHEEAGGEMTDVWHVVHALNGVDEGTIKGSKVWPEYLGGAAHDFRVELVGPPGKKRINALVHKTSGVRRERASLEAAIAQRIHAAAGGPADIRDLVGGPDRYLQLDESGRNRKPTPTQRPNVPLLKTRKQSQ